MTETARSAVQVATGRAARTAQRPARTAEVGRTGRRATIGDALASVVAIVVALIFFFPIYWAISNSLRKPAETFTVTGLGIPFVNFTPTLENWSQQFRVPEILRRVPQQHGDLVLGGRDRAGARAARGLCARALSLLHGAEQGPDRLVPVAKGAAAGRDRGAVLHRVLVARPAGYPSCADPGRRRPSSCRSSW